jgi:hypothetical protein
MTAATAVIVLQYIQDVNLNISSRQKGRGGYYFRINVR